MTDIVNPRPVRDMPPAPLDSDPPAIFDDKAKNLALWYPNWVDDNNNQAADNRQNAQATYELAQAARGSAEDAEGFAQDASDRVVEANQAVTDVRDALEAIQAGPVASVMGKTGVVTGLTETAIGAARDKTNLMANAPNGQWVAYSSLNGAGADWPTTAGISWWNVLTLGGDDGVGNERKTQIAMQAFTQSDQAGMFIRAKHDATWSPWQRMLSDRLLIERSKYFNAAAPTYAIDPAVATVNYIDIYNAATINVVNARGLGDELTIMFSIPVVAPISFSSNVKPPPGGLPALTAGTIMTVALMGRNDGTWSLQGGGINPW